jgi:glutaredoxin
LTDWLIVYTTSAFECPWCIKLKELLNVYGFDFYEKDINENEEAKKEFIAAGHRTVPQLYHEGVLIGGYEVSKLYLRRRFFDDLPHEQKALVLSELKETILE